MSRPRIIPILLLKNKGLVKSVKFKNHRYIGDPINAVRIFNDLKADELVFLDILASKEGRVISLDFVRKVGDEANMPFAVGGGIRSIEAIKQIINAGAEKVVVNTYAIENPAFIKEASDVFGSSTIVVSLDVRKGRIYTAGGRKATRLDPVKFAKLMEMNGAGELIINSVDRDGTMTGYDLDMIKLISSAVNIPVVALGGAAKLNDFFLAIESYASAVAAGSMFVYHGARNAVLLSYPALAEIKKTFK